MKKWAVDLRQIGAALGAGDYKQREKKEGAEGCCLLYVLVSLEVIACQKKKNIEIYPLLVIHLLIMFY